MCIYFDAGRYSESWHYGCESRNLRSDQSSWKLTSATGMFLPADSYRSCLLSRSIKREYGTEEFTVNEQVWFCTLNLAPLCLTRFNFNQLLLRYLTEVMLKWLTTHVILHPQLAWLIQCLNRERSSVWSIDYGIICSCRPSNGLIHEVTTQQWRWWLAQNRLTFHRQLLNSVPYLRERSNVICRKLAFQWFWPGVEVILNCFRLSFAAHCVHRQHPLNVLASLKRCDWKCIRLF